MTAAGGQEAPVTGRKLPRLVFSPAPGLHIFWHDGHVMWIEREIAMNLQVVELKESKAKKKLSFGKQKMKAKSLVVFSRQFATMIDAGIPVMGYNFYMPDIKVYPEKMQ